MGEETEPSGTYKEETEWGPQVLTDLFLHLMNFFFFFGGKLFIFQKLYKVNRAKYLEWNFEKGSKEHWEFSQFYYLITLT